MKIAEAVSLDGFPSVVVNGEPYYFNNNSWRRAGLTVWTAEDVAKAAALFAQNATQFPLWAPEMEDE